MARLETPLPSYLQETAWIRPVLSRYFLVRLLTDNNKLSAFIADCHSDPPSPTAETPSTLTDLLRNAARWQFRSSFSHWLHEQVQKTDLCSTAVLYCRPQHLGDVKHTEHDKP